MEEERVSQLRNVLFWEIMITGHRLLQPLRSLKCPNPATQSDMNAYYRLCAARKEAGLTQTQVAKHFQTHASFVSKVESGERRLDVVELADFCRLYRITTRRISEESRS